MRTTILSSTLIIFAFFYGFSSNGKNNFPLSKPAFSLQYDTSAAKVEEFKQFSKLFFSAVMKNDTSFVKDHSLLPIYNSSFEIFDRKLLGKKSVDKRILLKNLRKLFPAEIINRIQVEGIFAAPGPRMKKSSYIITVYDGSGDVDSNYKWFFTKKDGKFYFTNFRTEAG